MSTLFSPASHNTLTEGPRIPPELFEIFQSEADELLQSIENNLELLAANSANKEILWEIRRNAHTLKGAAGAVGIDAVVALSHLFEDVVNTFGRTSTASSLTLLSDIAGLARSVIDGNNSRISDKLSALRDRAARSDDPSPKVDLPAAVAPKHPQYSNPALNPANVARVSLLKIDECLSVAAQLLERESAIAAQIDILNAQGSELIRYAEKLEVADSREAILKSGREISSLGNAILLLATELASGAAFDKERNRDLNSKLETMRMIAFGTIAPRLMGSIRAACEEAGTRAELIIENGEAEIDTVLLADMAEPLLHLLRNSAVHGIETPEQRVSAGKSETGKIMLSVALDHAGYMITIADDGRGIDIEALKLKAEKAGIISPHDARALNDSDALQLIFLEGISTAKTLGMSAGRGVGMRIVKESVESKNGTIAVASIPGSGTIFTVSLPSYVSDRDRAKTKMELSADYGSAESISILVVDDSPSIRYAAVRTIESRGWRAIAASGGRAALAILSNINDLPAVIISDIEMPEMNGFELVANLKSDEKLCEIPVVMCSSRQDESCVRTMQELKVRGFVPKPFTENDLVKAIENAGAQISITSTADC